MKHFDEWVAELADHVREKVKPRVRVSKDDVGMFYCPNVPSLEIFEIGKVVAREKEQKKQELEANLPYSLDRTGPDWILDNENMKWRLKSPYKTEIWRRVGDVWRHLKHGYECQAGDIRISFTGSIFIFSSVTNKWIPCDNPFECPHPDIKPHNKKSDYSLKYDGPDWQKINGEWSLKTPDKSEVWRLVDGVWRLMNPSFRLGRYEWIYKIGDVMLTYLGNTYELNGEGKWGEIPPPFKRPHDTDDTQPTAQTELITVTGDLTLSNDETEHLVCQEWVCTGELRAKMLGNTLGEWRLQQKWYDKLTGKIEWRQITEVIFPESEVEEFRARINKE